MTSMYRGEGSGSSQAAFRPNRHEGSRRDEAIGDFLGDLGNAVRDNPVSAALITMGVAWMFFGGRTSSLASGVAHGARGVASSASYGAHAAGDALAGAGSTLGRAASSVASHASDAFSAVSEGIGSASHGAGTLAAGTGSSIYGASRATGRAGGDAASYMHQNLSDMIERQPLLLGAVGLAIGAGVAATLPVTDAESRLMGETSDAFKEQAQNAVSEQWTKAMSLADRALHEVKREAEAQGLSEDAVADAIRSFGEKLANVTAAAQDGLSKELRAADRKISSADVG